jgi:hypothetical protein
MRPIPNTALIYTYVSNIYTVEIDKNRTTQGTQILVTLWLLFS